MGPVAPALQALGVDLGKILTTGLVDTVGKIPEILERGLKSLEEKKAESIAQKASLQDPTLDQYGPVMMVQNEIGTVQDIKELAKQVRKLRKEHPTVEIRLHTDATQAPLFYDLTVAKLGVDMMTLGATKLYCQKGVGMLYKKRGIIVSSLTHGGGQEFGLRPGTEPVALIHEFAHALAYAQSHREEATEKITALQTYFENQIPKVLPSVQITARTTEDNPMGLRSPHITHIVVPNIESELLVIELDARGIAVSSKSACKNEQDQDSGILTLLYPNENLGAIRVSYGRTTTKRELDKTIRAIQSVLKKYQK
jgi:cysteine desulfurase